MSGPPPEAVLKTKNRDMKSPRWFRQTTQMGGHCYLMSSTHACQLRTSQSETQKHRLQNTKRNLKTSCNNRAQYYNQVQQALRFLPQKYLEFICFSHPATAPSFPYSLTTVSPSPLPAPPPCPCPVLLAASPQSLKAIILTHKSGHSQAQADLRPG